MTVKVPPNLAAKPMQVLYRSEKCLIKRFRPDRTSYEEDDYLVTMVQPQQHGQSDLYEAKLPIDGGGGCQWRLSTVDFGVIYANTTHFGQNVEANPEGGVIVMFDYYLPQQFSAFERTKEAGGHVLIRQNYYPWVSEHFVGGHKKLARLLGDSGTYLYYYALDARNVELEPQLHADYVVYSVEPEDNKGYTHFTYPDDSVVADDRGPNFQKLQAIRLGQPQ